MARLPMSDVIVLIPGIMGSVLKRHGKDVWAPAPGAALRAALSLGKSIKELRLLDDPPEIDDLEDGVVADRLVDDLHVLPELNWKIDGYTRLRKSLDAAFDIVRGVNYHEFP